MASLTQTIQRCFDGYRNSWYNSHYCDLYNNSNPISFMTVPIKEEAFEVPVAVLPILNDKRGKLKTVDEIAMCLAPSQRVLAYKSLDASVRNALSTPVRDVPTVKLTNVPDVGPYYCSMGAIYNTELYPVMMCSWLVHIDKEAESPLNTYVDLIRPIVRVDPQVFIDKNNAVNRYIVNKIIPSALSVSFTSWHTLPYRVVGGSLNHSIKVEIEKCPFKIKKPIVPTINTTNVNLINSVLDNIDDII